MKVKICGITNLEDAIISAEYGADAVGFIFFKRSPRCIDVKTAKGIINALPPFITKVGVFVNEGRDRINKIIDEAGIDIIQLHGDEPPEFCNGFKKGVIKAFKISDEGRWVRGSRKVVGQGLSLASLLKYRVSAYLLDTFEEGVEGGTGKAFNWEIAKEAKRFGRIILAGGLTPDNVADAIKRVKPYAVDVSSGVEERPGKKDPVMVREFIERAKSI